MRGTLISLVPRPLVVIAACAYAMAFVLPAWCNWLVGICWVPLYWHALTYRQSSWLCAMVQGVWWGIVFFGVHMAAIWPVIRAQASLQHTSMSWLLLVGYCASISGCWFAGAAFLGARVRSNAAVLSVWVLLTWCYIYTVDNFIFKIIALPRGYVFAYPLVPLAEHASWLIILDYVPPSIAVLMLLAGSALLTYALYTATWRSIFFTCICYAPYVVGLLWPHEVALFPYSNDIIYMPPPVYSDEDSPLDVAQALNKSMREALRVCPQVFCICFPESSYPFSLDQHHDIRLLWEQNALAYAQQTTKIVMGSHRLHNGNHVNSIICLQQCRIIQSYDKSTRVPFAEYVPWPWNKIRWLSELLLKNKIRFHQTNNAAYPLQLTPTLAVSPYLCSDLFFGRLRQDDGGYPILWLVNDSIFTMPYFRHLMVLYARLQARIYERPILYCAHTCGIWITPQGTFCNLPTVRGSQGSNLTLY